jgi:epoxide hydrolase-like predicted phosphatase
VGIKAVFYDLGGVILRTEYQAPREHLAESLNMEYEDLVRLVFESETARKASIGAVTADEHWATVTKKLRRPAQESKAIESEFFGGDVLDMELIEFIRSLKSTHTTGLISNAWSDLRSYIQAKKFDDAFHHIIISAEVGVTKPDPKIFNLALEKAGVKAEEALFVDDFIENINAAYELGMYTVHFKDPQKAMRQVKQLLSGN